MAARDVGAKVIFCRVRGNGGPIEAQAAVGRRAAPDLISLIGTKSNVCNIRQVEGIGGVAGNVNDVRVRRINTDAASIIVFGAEERTASLSDEALLPIGTGPAGVIVINAIVEPIGACHFVALDSEDANG